MLRFFLEGEGGGVPGRGVIKVTPSHRFRTLMLLCRSFGCFSDTYKHAVGGFPQHSSTLVFLYI